MGCDSDQYYKGCVRLLQEILGILSGAKSFWGLRRPDVEKLLNFLDILQILGVVEGRHDTEVMDIRIDD